MLKHAADLSDSYEYFLLWTGQSNARPWGTKAEGFSLFPDLENAPAGLSLTGVVIPNDGGRAAGTVETLTVATVLEAGAWHGAHLRLGSSASPVVGYARVLSNAAGTITVRWIAPSSAALPPNNSTQVGYLMREDGKWASYPNVRILTPYQPTTDDVAETDVAYPSPTATIANGGRALTIPGYTTPAGLTSFEDAGVLLPLTFLEGIEGYGISEAAGGGAATAAAATTFDFTTATTAGLFVQGYLRVDWYDGGEAKCSWTRIADNTANQFTGLSWQGDGTPTGTDSAWRWTAWLPHFQNSPYAYLPGEGFTYPNNDMQPCYKGAYNNRGAVIKNRPRGNATAGYGDTFGELVVFASRLSAAIGRRVNIVHLGINGAGLAADVDPVIGGFRGTIGWWNYENAQTFAPSVPTSLYQRVKKLLQTIVPNAMAAEANTRGVRFLGWVHVQGETDALSPSARQVYSRSIKTFVQTVRKLLDTLGYSPFTNGAKVPFVQPRIANVTYELSGTYTYLSIPFTFGGDADGLVNNAIVEHVAADGFAATVEVNDLPRVALDPGHYNGVGEAALGARCADAIADLFDYALGFGSPALSERSKVIDICNLALANIGEDANLVTLDDGSVQANACNRFWPQARDALLQVRQWAFATRRCKLQEVKRPAGVLFGQYAYCYVVPPDALNAFAVLPPAETVEDFDPLSVLSLTYTQQFVDAADPTGADDQTVFEGVNLPPIPYHIEQAPSGYRYLFTNQEDATLRYVSRVVDASLYPSQFFLAASWHLASMLAGAIIKGDQGEAVAARCAQKASAYLRAAAVSDANQSHVEAQSPYNQIPDHLAQR